MYERRLLVSLTSFHLLLLSIFRFLQKKSSYFFFFLFQASFAVPQVSIKITLFLRNFVIANPHRNLFRRPAPMILSHCFMVERPWAMTNTGTFTKSPSASETFFCVMLSKRTVASSKHKKFWGLGAPLALSIKTLFLPPKFARPSKKNKVCISHGASHLMSSAIYRRFRRFPCIVYGKNMYFYGAETYRRFVFLNRFPPEKSLHFCVTTPIVLGENFQVKRVDVLAVVIDRPLLRLFPKPSKSRRRGEFSAPRFVSDDANVLTGFDFPG